jgi:hypothetical protein
MKLGCRKTRKQSVLCGYVVEDDASHTAHTIFFPDKLILEFKNFRP